MTTKWRKFLILVLISTTCFVFGISFHTCVSQDRSPESPPNIVILLIDALRADSLSDYGNSRNTNPFLSDYANKGVRFTKAYSHSSHTKISVASLFTGLMPPIHKVRHGALLTRPGKNEKVTDVLSSRFVTIAEVFRKKGYNTAAFVTNPHIQAILGFSQGFTVFKSFSWDRSNANKVNNGVINWLKGYPKQPFFIYVHYMDIHAPYTAPGKYRFLYTEKKKYRPVERDGPWRSDITEERIEYTRARYEAQINYWDDCFRIFMEKMEKYGWTKNTLFIILSDHGEEFFDHGGFGHGFTLYEEQLKVPLYMIWEGHLPANQVRNDPVQLMDIFPTVCSFANRDVEKLSLPGRNLFSSGRKKGISEKITYAETFRGKAPRSVHNLKNKLVYNSAQKDFEFYDLINDPEEREDLYKENSPMIEKLKIRLFQVLFYEKLGPKAQEKELDSETIEQLRSLGYIK